MIQQTDSLKLSAQKREVSGSRPARQLRKNGWLPCIVYDSTGKSFSIQIKRHALEVLLRHRQGQNLILDLEIEGDKARKVLMKDIQQDRIKDHLLHVDFLEISMTRKLRLSVAITLVGEPVGITQQGGVMEHLLRSVEIECLPGDIINEFVLDVSNLSIGDTLSVRDIKADPKLTILTMPEIAVVSVQIPRFEEEKPAEEAVEGAVEGAVPAEGAEAAAAATEPGKEKEPKEKGKEGKEKEAVPTEKGKETKEKGKESKEKGKETKDKAK
ncbi:MAG: 50S ribosomal protein L25 [Kiritimatiellia bacterium]|nr:50S ribosomal protein L25 [Kiritimatiellia bacterium]